MGSRLLWQYWSPILVLALVVLTVIVGAIVSAL